MEDDYYYYQNDELALDFFGVSKEQEEDYSFNGAVTDLSNFTIDTTTGRKIVVYSGNNIIKPENKELLLNNDCEMKNTDDASKEAVESPVQKKTISFPKFVVMKETSTQTDDIEYFSNEYITIIGSKIRISLI